MKQMTDRPGVNRFPSDDPARDSGHDPALEPSATTAHAATAAEPATAASTKKSAVGGNGVSVKLFLGVVSLLVGIQAGGFAYIGDQIQGTHSRIDAQGVELRTEIHQAEARLTARIDATNARVDALASELRAELKAFANQLRALELAVTEVLVRMRLLETGQAHTDARLARIEGTLGLTALPQPPPGHSDDN